jgi:hypothetical protein
MAMACNAPNKGGVRRTRKRDRCSVIVPACLLGPERSSVR